MKHNEFTPFNLHERRDRKFIFIMAIASILQFSLFKFFYPFPDFSVESYNYVYGASAHLPINILPSGYSKFLQAFHIFTSSDTALISFQYFFLELSGAYFFFSLLNLYSLGKASKHLILLFLFLNPLFLYISNRITSESLFTALSILWLTDLLWIIHRPIRYHFFTQSSLLLLCFALNYNSCYYPIVTVLAFVLSKQQILQKIIGITLPILVLCIYSFHMRKEAQKLIGARKVSLYSGWQFASNAMYVRRYIPEMNNNRLGSEKWRQLDILNQQFYNQVPADFDADLADFDGDFFIRHSISPLRVYLIKYYHSTDGYFDVANWGKASVLFGEYGSWVITHYPGTYLRHFVLPNVKRYFLPPLGPLELYNEGEDEVDIMLQDWFDYKLPNITCSSKIIQSEILFPFPYIFLFLHAFIIGSVAKLTLLRKSLPISGKHRTTLLVFGVLLIVNFSYCVATSVIVMSDQFFSMIVLMGMSALTFESLEHKKESIKLNSPPAAEIRIHPVLGNT